MWFLSELYPQNTFYNIPLAYRLRGAIDERALERALTTVVQRHAALRTTFEAGGSGPVQVIHPSPDVVLRTEDILVPDEEIDSCVAARLIDEASSPFDLRVGPVLRTCLFRLRPDDHVLIMVFHHLAVDGWSLARVTREIGAIYRAVVAGDEPDLPDVKVQPSDVAARQLEWLNSSDAQSLSAYWRNRLTGIPAELELPHKAPRSRQPAFGAGRVAIPVPQDLLVCLRRFAIESRMSLFTVLLAGLQVTLSQWSGQRDVVVAVPTASRGSVEHEDVVGFFVNTVPVRSLINLDHSFRACFTQVRDGFVADLDHQDLPFEKIVEIVSPPRDVSRNPIAQVLFQLVSDETAVELDLGDIACERLVLGDEALTTRFDLEIHARQTGDGLTMDLLFGRDLFHPSTVARLGEHLVDLLARACTSPDAPLRSLASDQTFSSGGRLAPGGVLPADSVPEVVTRQARERPKALAVVDAHQAVTYGELEERSRRLAGALMRRGVAPGAVVAILLERTARMPEVVLGVLRAGACYLPLDPMLPPERMAYVLSDSAAALVVCDRANAGRVADWHRLVIDEPWDHPGADRDEPQLPILCPLHQAYVIYTSGSTGVPKGVVLSHGVLLNLVEWHVASLGASTGPVLQYAPLSFDASIHELLLAWACGVPAVIATDHERHDVDRLAALITRCHVERCILPGLVFDRLCRHRWPEAWPVDDVILTGERLQITPAMRRYFEANPTARLHNHYGPSETHVVTAKTMTGDPAGWPVVPSIGVPISEVRVVVRGDDFDPMPMGVEGELCISGAALADAYLADPRRTAERFVPDPAGWGERMYRTGDRGRLRVDGELEFLGRSDRQVKLRGFRVELGDVEAAVLKHPDVAAVAVALVGEGETASLAAFVISRLADLRVADVRAVLARSLPYYMVPSRILVVDELPRTSNGKVDVAALVAGTRPTRQEPSEEGGVFESAAMKSVAAIWQELLELSEPIPPDGNFFDLGGHSLLATQVIALVEERWQISIPLRAVFEAASVREFADVLDQSIRPITKTKGNRR